MAVTIHSPFKAPPSVSKAGFIAVLERTSSFSADPLWMPTDRDKRGDEAARIYDYIVDHGHDPARWLAILGKESSFGTNRNSVLWRNNTRSWTNARSIRHPEVEGGLITDEQRGSQYIRYKTAMDSIRDGVYRVDDLNYAYADAHSIAEVITVWAPSEDANDPGGYAQTMVDWINAWSEEFPVGEESMEDIGGTPFRIDYIPRGNSNRPGYAMTPEYITIHETANTRAGANAEMHRAFTHSGGGQYNVSFHYVVDDSEIIQLLPNDENGWHAGDGADGDGNRKSIGIELCVNSDGDWGKTMRNGAKLVTYLQEKHGIPDTNVVQHNHWSGKDCPSNMRANRGQGWRDFLTMVAGEKLEPEPASNCRYIEQTGHYICHGFRAYWESRDNPKEDGWPLSEEFEMDGMTVQYFERARYEWQPAIADNPHGVVRGLIGAESIITLTDQYPGAFERQEPPDA